MERPATNPEIEFLSDVSLAAYTTLGLGGKAKYFYECKTDEQIDWHWNS